MDYDEMPAGCEVDSLVAEKVMGWRSGIINDACRVIRLPYEGPGWETWSPSTDISAAWEIVEKMGRPIEIKGLYSPPEKWQVEVGGYTRTRSYGEQLPLAICRAALKAAKGEVVKIQEG